MQKDMLIIYSCIYILYDLRRFHVDITNFVAKLIIPVQGIYIQSLIHSALMNPSNVLEATMKNITAFLYSLFQKHCFFFLQGVMGQAALTQGHRSDNFPST